VPTGFKFGGVLEFRDTNPRRFTAIIEYHGSSLDPSEQYIRAKMTSVGQMVRTGSGKVLAVFRTIPGAARSTVEEKLVVLNEAGIRGMCILGDVSQHICQIPVGQNQAGMILFGGLNPVAAAVEEGVEIDNIAESGLIEYDSLRPFSKAV
jgi:repressor of nif and glnA expression